MAAAAARWPWALLCLAATPLLCPAAGGLSCCYHAKDNLMCRDVCEQILSSKSDSRLKHLLQRAPEYCPESMREVWGCINSSLPVYTGEMNLQEWQISEISCKVRSKDLHLMEEGRISLYIEVVTLKITLSGRELCTKLYSTSWGNSQSWQEFDRFCEYNAVEVSMLTCLADVREPCQLGCRNLTYCTNFNNRSDCVEILKKCGDHNKFPEGHSAESICELLSPTDDLENCIPLDTYLSCKLGEASDFIVRQGTLIQVPSSAGDVGCYKICTCGHSGLLENCMEMHCVDLQKSCIVGGQRKSLPCNCVDQFVPVCGQNGRTYPSACIARCVGLQDNQFEFGSCISKDPCNPNPCNKNQRCIPKKQVCLTSFEKFECSQHECVPRQLNCDQTRDPVCDTDNVEYTNLCTLYQKGKSLAYRGPCQPFCRSPEPVCGHNGETYSSVCAAYADRVAVDYHGHCQAVGALSDHGFHSECAFVRCPQLSAAGCKPVLAPGACCPLCAGMLRILYDKDKLDNFARVTNKKPITILDILEKIRLHVSVPQCDVFGYLSIESEIVILIIPVDQNPKPLQVDDVIILFTQHGFASLLYT
ncbi:reversion inducing cysteine rich protein with kazal motif protein [Turdus rufiventris]|nr:reversion inducing cysteine rich protein with kazal motif protein [Turdus rufiventris]